MLDPEQFAESIAKMMRSEVSRATAPLLARIAELDEAIKAIPAGPKGDAGERGEKGDTGQEGTPGERGERGEQGIEGKAADEASIRAAIISEIPAVVAKAMEALPKPTDGRDGRDGLPGLNGEKGIDGADGKDGKDGADGFGLEDFKAELGDDGRSVLLSFERGERKAHAVLTLPVPLDRGVYLESKVYQRGDGVTFGGSWWIAQKAAPEGKPGTSPDWRLACKRGRDGADFRPTNVRSSEQIRLNGTKRP